MFQLLICAAQTHQHRCHSCVQADWVACNGVVLEQMMDTAPSEPRSGSSFKKDSSSNTCLGNCLRKAVGKGLVSRCGRLLAGCHAANFLALLRARCC